MVKYYFLEYDSLNDYNIDFKESLLETNHTPAFFVSWEKVFNKLKDSLIEIEILNSLNKVDSSEVEPFFRKILIQHPEVIPILPSIIAVRDKDISYLDPESNNFKNILFSQNDFNIDDIVNFSKESGLLYLFTKIDDLYSYLIGTEVGLDTHSRKSRSGKSFEDIVGKLLSSKINNYPQFSLRKEETISFQRTKRWDYVIYENNEPKFLIECNFYNGTGSKPIEVAHSYADLQKQINKTNFIFIWVTDGKGWKKMFNSLQEVSSEIDFILNYQMLKNNIDKFFNEY